MCNDDKVLFFCLFGIQFTFYQPLHLRSGLGGDDLQAGRLGAGVGSLRMGPRVVGTYPGFVSVVMKQISSFKVGVGSPIKRSKTMDIQSNGAVLALAPSRKVLERLKDALRRGGPAYAFLHSVRWAIQRVMDGLDLRLVHIEQRRRIVEDWTISARRFTAHDNKVLWNTYDWSMRGEEWTKNAARPEEWKRSLIEEFMIPYVPENAVVVEVVPGAGR